MSYLPVARKARKDRSCTCGRLIAAGEVYILHTEFPGGDAGYADAAGHPVSLPECAEEAERYGRGHLIEERRNRPLLTPPADHEGSPMTAYREVWIECDGCNKPFGRDGGYLTQGAVVAGARTCGWMERRERPREGATVATHYCPACRDKP